MIAGVDVDVRRAEVTVKPESQKRNDNGKERS